MFKEFNFGARKTVMVRKDTMVGGWGQCRVWAGKWAKCFSFVPLEFIIESKSGNTYPLSTGYVFSSAMQ